MPNGRTGSPQHQQFVKEYRAPASAGATGARRTGASAVHQLAVLERSVSRVINLDIGRHQAMYWQTMAIETCFSNSAESAVKRKARLAPAASEPTSFSLPTLRD